MKITKTFVCPNGHSTTSIVEHFVSTIDCAKCGVKATYIMAPEDGNMVAGTTSCSFPSWMDDPFIKPINVNKESM